MLRSMSTGIHREKLLIVQLKRLEGLRLARELHNTFIYEDQRRLEDFQVCENALNLDPHKSRAASRQQWRWVINCIIAARHFTVLWLCQRGSITQVPGLKRVPPRLLRAARRSLRLLADADQYPIVILNSIWISDWWVPVPTPALLTVGICRHVRWDVLMTWYPSCLLYLLTMRLCCYWIRFGKRGTRAAQTLLSYVVLLNMLVSLVLVMVLRART